MEHYIFYCKLSLLAVLSLITACCMLSRRWYVNLAAFLACLSGETFLAHLFFPGYMLCPAAASFIILFLSRIWDLSRTPAKGNGADPIRLPVRSGIRESRLEFYYHYSNFLVYGGAGSGKTKSIGKWLLSEYMRLDSPDSSMTSRIRTIPVPPTTSLKGTGIRTSSTMSVSTGLNVVPVQPAQGGEGPHGTDPADGGRAARAASQEGTAERMGRRRSGHPPRRGVPVLGRVPRALHAAAYTGLHHDRLGKAALPVPAAEPRVGNAGRRLSEGGRFREDPGILSLHAV